MKKSPATTAEKNPAVKQQQSPKQHANDQQPPADSVVGQPVSFRTHIALALIVCTIAYVASYSGLIAGGRQNIDLLTTTLATRFSTLFGSSEPSVRPLHNVCSGQGVLVQDTADCFCDLGWSGDDCSIATRDVEQTAVTPNSILYVVESFGELVGSKTARTQKATVSDVVTIQDASIYETLATQMAAAGAVVTVLYVGEVADGADQTRFNSLAAHYDKQGIELLSLPPTPKILTGASSAASRSYALYRYLTTPGVNTFAVIQAPTHSGVLHYTLQARSQGHACFSQTQFVAHVDSVPQSLAERLANGDMDGSMFGKQYGGSEAQITEMLRADFMAQNCAQQSDLVVVGNKFLADYIVNELRWSIAADKIKLAQEIPVVLQKPAQQRSVNHGIVELVFVGTPQLTAAAGLKLMVDAMDALKSTKANKKNVQVTFLGHSVEMTNPKLASEEFIDLRSYNWPLNVAWKFVEANSVPEMLSYLLKSDTHKLAVLPYISSTTGTTFLLNSLLANGVPFTVSRDAVAESLVLYDDWQDALFQANSSKALAASLATSIANFGQSFLATRASSDVAVNPSRLWAETIYTRLFEQSAKSVTGTCTHSLFFSAPPADLPMVSIVLVHHDRVELVKQAIQSIELQTYPQDRIEVILVDDGSSQPESIKFINDLAWQWWETKGWKVIREPQRWLGAARNTGASNAKGDFIVFLDDDDVAKPHKIATMIKVALNTNADIVTSGHDLFHSTDYPQTFTNALSTGRFVPLGAAADTGMFQNVYGDSSFLTRRSFFRDVKGFTEDFGVGFEDYEFFAKAALQHNARIETIPEALTWYRKLNAGTAMTENTELKENQVRMMRPYVASYQTQSAWSQNLMQYAQTRLFERGIEDDNPFQEALANMTSSMISMSSSSQVFSASSSSSQVFSASSSLASSLAQKSTIVVVATSTVAMSVGPTLSAESLTLDGSASSSSVSSSIVDALTSSSVAVTPTSTSSDAQSSSEALSSSIVSSDSASSSVVVVATSTVSPSSTVASSSVVSVPTPSVSVCTTSQRDCNGNCPTDPQFNATIKADACGICGGNGATCTDCKGVVFGTAKPDNCGECNGDNSKCTVLVAVLPNPIVNRAGVFVVLSGAGFRPTDKIYVNNQLAARSAYNSSSVATVYFDSPTPFDGYFLNNPQSNTSQFPVSIDFGDRGKSAVLQLTVYRDTAIITNVTASSTVLGSGVQNVITIDGTGFLQYNQSSCWFEYTALDWNSDFTAQIYRTFFQSSRVTFVSSQRVTCPGPVLTESSEVVINLSFSGVGYDQVSVGSVTLSFPSFLFVNSNRRNFFIYRAPAPKVVDTVLDSTGIFTYVRFDSATNGLELTNTSCQALFDTDPVLHGVASAPSNYSKLSSGAATDCRAFFRDPYTLAMTVSADFAAQFPQQAPAPGKIIRFAGGVLKRSRERFFDWFSGDSLPIAAPLAPVAPAIEVVAGRFLGACSALDLDLTSSTGSGGRYFTAATYSVQISSDLTGTASAQLALNSLLANVSQSALTGNLFYTVPRDFFPVSGIYTFTFQLANFLGAVSSKSFAVYVDTAAVIPIIRIQGPSQGRGYCENAVKLMALLKFTADETCLKARNLVSNDAANIQWRMVTPGRPAIMASWRSESGAELVIPPYAYQPGYAIDFEVTVKLGKAGQAFTTAYQLQYGYGSMSALVLGGHRQMGFDSAINLRAVVLDKTWKNKATLYSHIAEYTFGWQCQLVSAKGVASACLDRRTGLQVEAMSSVSDLVSLPRGALLPTDTTNSYYNFTLTVNHTLSGRVSVESAIYRLTTAPVPPVEVTINSKQPSARDSAFSLFADIGAKLDAKAYDFIWLSQSKCGGVAFATLNISNPANLNAVPNSQTLAFNTIGSAPALQPGQTYCMEVLVRPKVGAVAGSFGRSAAVFTVRQEPDYGSCRLVGATTGEALKTQFTIRCGEWSTDPLSGNIWYTFYQRTEDGKVTQRGLKTKNGIYTMMFADVGQVTIIVEVSDDAGGVARSSPQMTVTVTKNTSGVKSIAAAMSLQSAANFNKDSNAPAAMESSAVLARVNMTQSDDNSGTDGPASSSFVRLHKRQLTSVQQTQFALLGTLVQKSSVDHQDVGPMILTLLQSIVAGGPSADEAAESIQLLDSLLQKMGSTARDTRSCYTAQTAGDILGLSDTLFSLSDNQTFVASSRLSLTQLLTGCMQRRTVCGGNPVALSSQMTGQTLTVGTSAVSSSSYGIFSVPQLGDSIGAVDGECVQFYYGSGPNTLGVENGTVDDAVYVLEFRNATVNNGGPVSAGDVAQSDAIDTAQLSQPAVFMIPLSAAASAKVQQEADYQPSCAFYKRLAPDYTTGQWDTTGCSVLNFTSAYVTCQCTHLTEFAIRVDVREKQPTVTPPSNTPGTSAEALAGLESGTIAGIAIGVCAAVFAMLLVTRRVQHKKLVEAGRVLPFDDLDGGMVDGSSVPSAQRGKAMQYTDLSAVSPQSVDSSAAATRADPSVLLSATNTTTAVLEPTITMPLSPLTVSALPAYQLPPSYDEHLSRTKPAGGDSAQK